MKYFGVADLKDPAVNQQLRDKHPRRSRPRPRTEKRKCVDRFEWLKDDLLGLEDGVALRGLRNKYLKVSAEKMIREHLIVMVQLVY